MINELNELNRKMKPDYSQKEIFDRCKPKWQYYTENTSIGYVCSYGHEQDDNDIQFSVSENPKDYTWIWEIYRIDDDKIVRCGFDNTRANAEQTAFNMALQECQYARKENKYKVNNKKKKTKNKIIMEG